MLVLAINTLNNIQLIAATNIFHPDGTITSSPSSTSTSSCTACLASCSKVGAMFFSCETSCGPATVCPTSTSSNEVVTTTTKAYDGPAPVKATPTSSSAPIPSCAMDKPAVVPGSIFAGSKYNVVDHFCDEVAKKPEDKLNWIVDINGNQIKPKRRAVEARSPPVTPDTYKDYTVALSWAPNLHPASTPVTVSRGVRMLFSLLGEDHVSFVPSPNKIKAHKQDTNT